MTISGRDAKALRRARRLQIELRELQKDLDEQRGVALRSQTLDGMPGRCADADRMTARLIRIEQMERKVRDMERHAEAAQWEAKRICLRMKDMKARIFLEAYYAEAQPLETAIRTAGVAQRTALQYVRLAGDTLPGGDDEKCPVMSR